MEALKIGAAPAKKGKEEGAGDRELVIEQTMKRCEAACSRLDGDLREELDTIFSVWTR